MPKAVRDSFESTDRLSFWEMSFLEFLEFLEFLDCQSFYLRGKLRQAQSVLVCNPVSVTSLPAEKMPH